MEGRWTGKANGFPATLEFLGLGDGVRFQLSLVQGPTVSRAVLSGRYDPASGAIQLSGSGYAFQGTVAGDRMQGTYTVGRGKKQLTWAASR